MRTKRRPARGYHLQTMTTEENAAFVEQHAASNRWTNSVFIDYLLTLIRVSYEDSQDFNEAVKAIATYRTYMQAKSHEHITRSDQ